MRTSGWHAGHVGPEWGSQYIESAKKPRVSSHENKWSFTWLVPRRVYSYPCRGGTKWAPWFSGVKIFVVRHYRGLYNLFVVKCAISQLHNYYTTMFQSSFLIRPFPAEISVKIREILINTYKRTANRIQPNYIEQLHAWASSLLLLIRLYIYMQYNYTQHEIIYINNCNHLVHAHTCIRTLYYIVTLDRTGCIFSKSMEYTIAWIYTCIPI